MKITPKYLRSRHISLCSLLLVSLFFGTGLHAQTQVGSAVYGENPDDAFGYSVSINDDGSTIAVGAYTNDGNGSNSGQVRVFRYSNGTWTQLGSDLDGEASSDFFGTAVALSEDGNTLAVGAFLNDGNGNNSGHVRVFNFSGGSWSQVGSDIDGEASNNFSGESISLSDDGSIVAIGALYNGGNGASSGHARVYKLINGTWTQQGSDIDGAAAGDNAGIVSLSANGLRLALGSISNDGSFSNAGHVRIFDFVNNTWTQVGSAIEGEGQFDNSGRDLSLSSDGNTVAIGATYNDGGGSDAGHVRVFRLVGNTWTQLGADIDGEAQDNYSGIAVDLDENGNTVIIGANGNAGGGTARGHVRIFTYTNGSWVQVGQDIDGFADNDNFGYAARMSDDGSRVVVGARSNDGNGSNSGAAYVYCIPSYAEIITTVCDSFVVPSGDEVYYTSGTYRDTISNSKGCDSLMTFQVTLNNSSSSNLNITACVSYIFPSGQDTATASGIYVDHMTNSVGCDSAITLNVTLLSASQVQIGINACNSYTVPSGDETYTTSGVYYDTLTNQVGCDSVLRINLIINQATSSSFSALGCGSYVSPSGKIWNVAGNYMDTISNAAGCDSFMMIALTLGNASSSAISIEACGAYQSPSGKYTYTSDGTYYDTLTNASGCDSIITITAQITLLDPTVTVSGGMLIANEMNASGYQWYDCNNNNTEIPGADSRTFTPTSNGTYGVHLELNDCIDSSECTVVTGVSIDRKPKDQTVDIYPNPTNGDLNIVLKYEQDQITLVLRNVLGQELDRQQYGSTAAIDYTLNQVPGTYLLEIHTGDGQVLLKKVVKYD